MKSSLKKASLSAGTRNALWGYGFIAIWLIGFFGFTLYPTVYSFIISLNDVRLMVRMTCSQYILEMLRM